MSVTNHVPVWRESKKRKSSVKDKFYFLDIGLARYLQGRNELVASDDDFGISFESYIFHELSAHSTDCSGLPLAYWHTTTGHKVDFLYGNTLAIEVKATHAVTKKHLKGLRALMEENAFQNYILVSRDPYERIVEGCRLMPYTQFLDELWSWLGEG